VNFSEFAVIIWHKKSFSVGEPKSWISHNLKKLLIKRAGIKIIQRNVRKWCALRGWNWFKLLGRVRPLIKENQEREDSFAELENINKNYSRLEADFAREEKRRKELEAETERLKAERQQLEMALTRERDRYAEAETHVKRTDGQKAELERQVEPIKKFFPNLISKI